jgi:hypothetical protein
MIVIEFLVTDLETEFPHARRRYAGADVETVAGRLQLI